MWIGATKHAGVWLTRHKGVVAGILGVALFSSLVFPALVVFTIFQVVFSAAGAAEAEDERAGPCESVLIEAADVTAADLDETQLGHAGVVISEGLRRELPERAIVVALATVAQESRFRNYANDGSSPKLTRAQATGIGESLKYPHDAVGDDHDSIGLFQQRPSQGWGAIAELMDPVTATGRFYDALVEVDGWEDMPVTQAAQAVQRSAFPDAYAKWEPLAVELLQSSNTSGTAAAEFVETSAPECGSVANGDPGGWALPLAPGIYTISSHFLGGFRITGGHSGVDFAAPMFTEVQAAASGTVTSAGWASGYGNLVVIASGGVEHYYAHLARGTIAVEEGDDVAVGDLVGGVGSTGNSTGPHLHFEIRIDGDPIDPIPFLTEHGLTVEA